MKVFSTPMFGLPRPARHEQGEGWGEGQLNQALKRSRTSSPLTIAAIAAPPFHGGEGVMRADSSGGAR